MKFLTLASLATGAFAGVLVQRDLATIQAVMAASGEGIIGLDNAFKGFTGDPAALLAASNSFIQTLKDGKAKVDPLPELSLTEALGLQAPAGDLQKKGDALLATLKAKKDAIAANGLCEVTFSQTSSINSASKDLINTIVSKVPEAAQGIARGIVAGLLKDLQDAQDAVSPANCKNTGTGPTSSAPGTPSTTSAAPPGSTTAAPPTATAAPPTTTSGPPASDTCPAASTVTVTAIDTKDCTPTPTCTKTPPVTVTTTKKACPTKARLPW